MTSEQRLDRLERIAWLFVTATLRARRHSRDQDRKIDHLINMQIENENKFARMSEETERRSARMDERIARLSAEAAQRSAQMDERITTLSVEAARRSAQVDEKFAMVAELQAATDQRLNNLIDLLGYNSFT